MKRFKSFRQFTEESSKPIAFTFGRFNPPTIGHEVLIKEVASQGVPFRIYTSQDQDENNPLSYDDKISYMRRMFESYGRQIIKDTNITDLESIAETLYAEGYNKLILFIDKEQASICKRALAEKFNDIKVISLKRNPDQNTLIKEAANDNYQAFSADLPKTFKDGQGLFNDVRAGMGLEESTSFRPHIDLGQKDKLRERYLMNRVFNLDDSVTDNKHGKAWKITERHSNFVVTENTENSQIKKFFLHDIEPA